MTHLQAYTHACFSAWPAEQNEMMQQLQSRLNHNSAQQDPFAFATSQNTIWSWGPSQDWYQQHRQFILSNIVNVAVQDKQIKITPEDIALINRICADNPHTSADLLRMQLAQSSAFNYAQHFLKGDNLLSAFTPDLFIDPAHYLTMQIRHIFYPSLQPKFYPDYQSIREINLNGFHHDEYGALEQSGLFTFINKTYGQASLGAQECFKAHVDFGNGIVTKNMKIFFPSGWSREKTAQVIFEAAQNRIEDLSDPRLPHQKKYRCRHSNNMLIEIIFNKNNVMTSAYPSDKNF